MINVEVVDGGVLVAAPWRSNYVLRPDQKTLAESLRLYGWTAPIVASSRTQMIIDGHERWLIAVNDAEVVARDGGKVPVLWVDCDEIEAMMMHVRINRGRGSLYAKPLSNLVRRVLRSGAYDENQLRTVLGMSLDEMELLSDGGFVKSRKIAEHKYSKAWVPVEAPPGAVAPSMSIERPPNADR